ncbi:hypothetical protein OG705_28990 [Streptomyces sp. NBC_00838]|uniref:hypothetical protein n=1 Tax=Streptomyces sp. NBC_00838 TaxID=2903680 RepID=UPI00386FC2AA|nr:hypothetical protein OG705_28990 [Streptomyces sp. NBC_00838]
MPTDSELKVLPKSSVPAAFDRGHLYSPTLALTRFVLVGGYIYDYRPGDLYEPMPATPSEPEALAWWRRNIAATPVPDFLGLLVGDQISVQHVTSTGHAEVIATERAGAVVRYPLPKSDFSTKTHAEMYIRRRNGAGHWYP